MSAERGIEAIGKETNRLRAQEGGRAEIRPLNKTFFPFSAVGRRKMDRLNYDFFHTWMRKERERDVEFE